MPVNIQWDDEAQTRVLFEFSGKWTWDEYQKARQQGIRMTTDLPQIVNLIVDYSHCDMFPSNMLSHFGSSIEQNPKPFELAVIVTGSPFVKTLVNVITKVYTRKGVNFKVARTLEDARKIFAEHEAKRAVSKSVPL
ncbi:MAG: hypothetical protein U0694_13055 [Anaerolineae bacterium]